MDFRLSGYSVMSVHVKIAVGRLINERAPFNAHDESLQGVNSTYRFLVRSPLHKRVSASRQSPLHWPSARIFEMTRLCGFDHKQDKTKLFSEWYRIIKSGIGKNANESNYGDEGRHNITLRKIYGICYYKVTTI